MSEVDLLKQKIDGILSKELGEITYSNLYNDHLRANAIVDKIIDGTCKLAVISKELFPLYRDVIASKTFNDEKYARYLLRKIAVEDEHGQLFRINGLICLDGVSLSEYEFCISPCIWGDGYIRGFIKYEGE